MVARGKFVLHSRAVPPLTAGDYVLTGDQSITAGEVRPTATNSTNLRVTSPRFRLPPDQMLSVFPPANSQGAFESRLPQIVLKRRTLPWERAVDPVDRTVPWLALVVIAEGEGELSDESPVEQCVTPGVTLSGPNDVARGIFLTVPKTTVDRVFPTRQDLSLLAHVREVDLEDTENAMGDDDGFLAVVLANRLPQYDRVACKPMRYVACLINLEGQLGALPPPSNPRPFFDVTAAVFDIQTYYVSDGGAPDNIAMTQGATKARIPDPKQAKPAAPKKGAAAEWLVAAQKIETVALTTASAKASFAVRDAMKTGFRLPIEGVVREKTYRFPILAHWSFTCDGAGSFESLMHDLDVGLLGTLPGPNAPKRRPDCAPPPQGVAPPDAPLPRPQPEVTETGHVGLAHITRVGDAVRAWYRGPFTPSPMTRDVVAAAGNPPLAHVSDQLRAVTPDGREDVSLAVAFEIGRLLALSRPAFVNALMQWRREQFGAERARRLAAIAVKSVGRVADAVKDSAASALGPLIGRTVVLETAAKAKEVLGPFREPVDPGRPIDFLRGNLGELLSVGLAVDAGALRQAASGSLVAIDASKVPLASAERVAGDTSHLVDAVAAEAQRLATDALANQVRRDSISGRSAATPDALDALIEALTAARRRER
jgi:hypothetical protein